MPVPMARDTHTKTVTIAISGNLSGAIDMRRYSMLIVHMPAAWTAASIGFKVSSSDAGTFQALYDDDGDLVQIDSPAASASYQANAEVAGAHWVKLWSQNGSGTNTAQAAARTLVLDLKS
jgi:hypothetical protein